MFFATLGFSASEGFFGIPLRSGSPDGVLHVQGAFLEFAEEHDTLPSHTLLAHELQVGHRYRIIVSTGAGLWRYDMNDIIEVTGHHLATPLVRFLYKAGGTLNITGEKVTVAHAISVATRLAQRFPIEHLCATLELSDPPRYLIAIEPSNKEPLLPKNLAAAWDSAMCSENIEYAEKRHSNRLAPPRVRLVSTGTFHQWRRRRVADGAPDGQVKLPPLLGSSHELLRQLDLQHEH